MYLGAGELNYIHWGPGPTPPIDQWPPTKAFISHY